MLLPLWRKGGCVEVTKHRRKGGEFINNTPLTPLFLEGELIFFLENDSLYAFAKAELF